MKRKGAEGAPVACRELGKGARRCEATLLELQILHLAQPASDNVIIGAKLDGIGVDSATHILE